MTSKNGVFSEKNEFYSNLKQSPVSDEEYECPNFLFHKLKMRNLSDMNDLYNFQDTCLLCNIIENRFETMHKMYGFNSRRCNSTSTLSGCIERNLSKVIVALPGNKEDMMLFEKTLTGGLLV